VPAFFERIGNRNLAFVRRDALSEGPEPPLRLLEQSITQCFEIVNSSSEILSHALHRCFDLVAFCFWNLPGYTDSATHPTIISGAGPRTG
jgi:hypothetical protein